MMLRRTSFAVVLVAAAVSTTCDSVPLTAPTNSSITLTAATRVLPVGGSTQLTAEVIEQSGTPVQNGTTVRFSTSLGRVEPVEAQTRNGIATATFFAGDDSGIADVRATSGGAGATGGTTTPPPTNGNGNGSTTTTPLTPGSSLQISIGAAAVETVTVRVNPARVSQNGGTVQVAATVVGTGGRLLANIPVNFSATHGSLSSGSALTDAAGEAHVSLTTNADTDVVATAGTKKSDPAKVTAQPGPSVTLTCAVGSTNNCATASTGDTVTFTASRSQTTSVIASSTLDFGDGQSESLGNLSSPAAVAHRYAQAGFYTARLSATDINGETTATSLVINVTDLIATISLNVTNTVTRTVQATATLSAAGATILRYEWTFGPDAVQASITTTTNSATTSFTTGGTKTVRVRVVLSDGRSAEAQAQIDVP